MRERRSPEGAMQLAVMQNVEMTIFHAFIRTCIASHLGHCILLLFFMSCLITGNRPLDSSLFFYAPIATL